MKQVVLNIEEGRYALFLQFLQTLNYVQVVQQPYRNPEQSTQPPVEKHFLSDLAGSMSGKDGDELAEIVNREFQRIEGEW